MVVFSPIFTSHFQVLQLLRLRQINNGVFVKLNNSTLQLLRIVDPYVAWGYPSWKTIHDLVYKRGFAKVDHRRIPITDNKIIEQSLGEFFLQSIASLNMQVEIRLRWN